MSYVGAATSQRGPGLSSLIILLQEDTVCETQAKCHPLSVFAFFSPCLIKCLLPSRHLQLPARTQGLAVLPWVPWALGGNAVFHCKLGCSEHKHSSASPSPAHHLTALDVYLYAQHCYCTAPRPSSHHQMCATSTHLAPVGLGMCLPHYQIPPDPSLAEQPYWCVPRFHKGIWERKSQDCFPTRLTQCDNFSSAAWALAAGPAAPLRNTCYENPYLSKAKLTWPTIK